MQWLSAQKMEDLLARWALALQEYEFTIHYHSGQENGNADALSRRTYPDIQLVAATTQTPILTHSLHQQQLTDPVIQQLHTALSQHPHRHVSPQGSKWCQPPLSRYKQLWPQLFINDGIVCRRYVPTPHLPAVTVPLIPASQCLTNIMILLQLVNWDLRKQLLRCVKLVIGLGCCDILTDIVESAVFVNVQSLQHQ